MKESKFIEQNKKNWQEFEGGLRGNQTRATRLSRLFVQITDDLSYARTFYKFRSVKTYLNGIAQVLFNDLYRNKRSSFNDFTRFWKVDLPLQMYGARKELLISFLVFIVAFAIGILSSMYDKEFARSILGDSYVNMTLENIKKGDPMAVYKKGNEMQMFMGISINNILVALQTFLTGVVVAVGSLVVLIRNGVMVGTFQYFFVEKGLFKESFLTIWQHGTLEISCIIVAGAAGIALGKGLLFPGTYSRLQSFKLSARRGLKIFTGVAPIILLAALIEGFFTRYTEVDPAIRIMVILFSAMFVFFYFVWYPRLVARRYAEAADTEAEATYRENAPYQIASILTPEEILGHVFRFIKEKLVWFVSLILGAAIIEGLTGVIFSFSAHGNGYYEKIHNAKTFFKLESIGWLFFVGIIIFTAIQTLTLNALYKKLTSQRRTLRSNVLCTVSAVLVSLILLTPMYWGAFWGIVSLVVVCPLLLIILYQDFLSGGFLFGEVSNAWGLMSKSVWKIWWNSIKLFIFLGVFYLVLNSQVAWHYFDAFYIGFSYDAKSTAMVSLFVQIFSVALLFTAFFVFQIVTAVFTWYSLNETVNAGSLNQRIDQFGQRNTIFGFDKEVTR
jgi:uncharacterized membrane protein SpoIIM required for sporulation